MVALTALAIWHLAVEDRLHQLAVVAHHRALTGMEAVRPRPAQPDANGHRALLGGLVGGAGIAGHVQPRDAERPTGPREVHSIRSPTTTTAAPSSWADAAAARRPAR